MELHVIFGAGQVGLPLMQVLLAQGHQVRVVRRTRAEVPAGVELVLGDAFDREFCVQSAAKATSVYHCLNVPYSTKAWATALPPLQSNLIEAAGKAKARLVVFENLYMLGAPSGTLTEESPLNPRSKKGELRAALSTALFEAHRAGQVRAVAGRASHLFGPNVTQSQIGAQLLTRVLAGKSAQVFGDVKALHSFSYAPDVARGLAALGSADDVLGRAWMLPVMPPQSNEAFYHALFAALGVSPRVDVISPLMLSMLGLFVPLLREMVEMNYEWQHDFVVSDAAFVRRFGFGASSPSGALVATAAWAKQTFTPAARKAA